MSSLDLGLSSCYSPNREDSPFVGLDMKNPPSHSKVFHNLLLIAVFFCESGYASRQKSSVASLLDHKIQWKVELENVSLESQALGAKDLLSRVEVYLGEESEPLVPCYIASSIESVEGQDSRACWKFQKSPKIQPSKNLNKNKSYLVSLQLEIQGQKSSNFFEEFLLEKRLIPLKGILRDKNEKKKLAEFRGDAKREFYVFLQAPKVSLHFLHHTLSISWEQPESVPCSDGKNRTPSLIHLFLVEEGDAANLTMEAQHYEMLGAKSQKDLELVDGHCTLDGARVSCDHKKAFLIPRQNKVFKVKSPAFEKKGAFFRSLNPKKRYLIIVQYEKGMEQVLLGGAPSHLETLTNSVGEDEKNAIPTCVLAGSAGGDLLAYAGLDRLRSFRDCFLARQSWGMVVVSGYYAVSARIQSYVLNRPQLRGLLQRVLVWLGAC